MTSRAVLWGAFAVVHLGVAALGFLQPNEPMGDVYRVYEPWAARALAGSGIVGITEPWVYPQLALVPMLFAHGLGVLVGSYVIGWVVLVAAVDAVAFAVLVGRATSAGRLAAAWFWLAFLALHGPAGMYRIDAITVPLAIIACLWLVGRPWAASVLLALATWIKVWPAAVLAAAVIAVRRRAAVVIGAGAVTAMTLLALLVADGYALGFIADQTGRGLQVEAPVSTPFLWGALLGADGFWVYYSFDILTYQVTGTGVDLVIAAMTPLLLLAVLAIAGVGAVKARQGVRFVSLFPVLSLALIAALIVCNKVGSPQFQSWLVAPLVLALVVRRRRWYGPACLALGTALLTQLVYPLLYEGVVVPEPTAVVVLTLRNIASIALLVWMVVRLVRLPVPARRGVAPAALRPAH